MIRSERYIYLLCAIAILFSGLASRRYRSVLPTFFAEYAGDSLWALMLFLLVSTLLAGRPLLVRAAISLALAFLVEISQLYHAPWIDSIRQTKLGGLVLGFGFLWTDSRLLLGRHCDRIAHGVGDRALSRAKIGEGFWALGFATAVLFKPIFGNGDLESSQ